MLSRILEPEVMDTVAEAEDYNAMDHSTVNRVFVDDFLSELAQMPAMEQPWRIFDAGTGTALIPLELAGRGLAVDITAADLAEEMLVVARRNLVAAGFQQTADSDPWQRAGSVIRLLKADCKQLSDETVSFDAVISNSIVHHIPEPRAVLRECWRVLRSGGLLFVRDLLRPDNLATLDRLVIAHAGQANPHARQMFRDSLHAALTVEEVKLLLQSLQITGIVSPTSDRHWTLAAIKGN